MEWGSLDYVTHLIATYGYLALGVIIRSEIANVPFASARICIVRATWWNGSSTRSCTAVAVDRKGAVRAAGQQLLHSGYFETQRVAAKFAEVSASHGKDGAACS